MALDETAIIIITALVATIIVLACALVIYTMKKRGKPTPIAKATAKEPELDSLLAPSFASSSPFRVTKSVQATEAVHAKDELRILDLEREILGGAIRHLYEAHAEGKISEAERERLASSYKSRMMAVKNSIAKDETIVALHELESMQQDLMKLFSERFGELTGKVDELRGRIDIKPVVKEVKIPMPKPQIAVVPDQMEKDDEEESAPPEKGKPKRTRKPASERGKSEAEQRIDAIRNQIDEVMNKLGQMEIES
ncbi:MAG: hypothetical protein NWF00_02890 [Candidatus Bathyarchaeota archaeon]|nr:hypothetical protein [Candidatus Bathyarchaeota archaeon]